METTLDKKQYEITYLLKDKNAESSLGGFLNQFGADILHQEIASETRLAYPIKKQRQAWLGFVRCALPPEMVEKIQQSLKLNSDVLRVLVVEATKGGAKDSRQSKKNFRSDLRSGADNHPAAAAEISPLPNSSGALSNEALREQLAALEGEAEIK